MGAATLPAGGAGALCPCRATCGARGCSFLSAEDADEGAYALVTDTSQQDALDGFEGVTHPPQDEYELVEVAMRDATSSAASNYSSTGSQRHSLYVFLAAPLLYNGKKSTTVCTR